MSGIFVEHAEIKDKPVHTARSGDTLWLMKVPTYVADRLRDQVETGQQFATIKTQRTPMGNKLYFEVDPKFCGKIGDQPECPSRHEMRLGSLSGPNRALAVCSETDDDIHMEGVIKTRFDVLQSLDTDRMSERSYFNLKRFQAAKNMGPEREVKIITNIQNPYAPSNVQRSQLYTTKEERDRKNDAKRTRLDRNTVENMILKAFQRNQYISQKHLVAITGQPEAYLKEFLHEMCVYNTRAPHKNTWELKPEYRHYDNDSKPSGSGTS